MSFFSGRKKKKALADKAEKNIEKTDNNEKTAESELKERDDKGLISKFRKGLNKTRDLLTSDIGELFSGSRINEEALELLEERLITADIGVESSLAVIERIRNTRLKIERDEDLIRLLKEEILKEIPEKKDPPLKEDLKAKPKVILVVGVNGVGKTTSIAKLAKYHKDQGKKVMLAAGDTFRAAAAEQLGLWAEKINAGFIRHKDGSDPAALAYDALDSAIARKMDVLIVDTAGRLHNKVNLMEELKKIDRTLDKRMPGTPHETLLVLDATNGQNALRQVELFNESIGLTGLILTKLDGSAKGGIAIAIQKNFDLPIEYIGTGEKIEDFYPFDAEDFIDAMFDKN